MVRWYYERAYGWLKWPVEWHALFRAECQALGMQYACSVYLPEDVATVAAFVDYLKISSFESDETAMQVAAQAFYAKVIVSLGMGSQGGCAGAHRLHCCSSYPAPLGDTNLSLLRDDSFSGISDHSRDLDMGMMAVCAGARIIETHYRLYDCDPENPDYAVAFDPGEFAEYILKIRKAERVMGDGVRRVQPSERAMLRYKVTA
jgi:sialic acid synthase SpsE